MNDENGEPWDLSIESVQRKALRKWEKEKPWLLVASPPCTMISLLQNLSLAKRDDAVVRMEVERAIKHLAFAVFLCKKQAAESRKFALEHPATASSWQLALTTELLSLASAERVTFDFCILGMKIEEGDGLGLKPVKKRTSVVMNSVKLAAELKQRQYKGDHVHANTLG